MKVIDFKKLKVGDKVITARKNKSNWLHAMEPSLGKEGVITFISDDGCSVKHDDEYNYYYWYYDTLELPAKPMSGKRAPKTRKPVVFLQGDLVRITRNTSGGFVNGTICKVVRPAAWDSRGKNRYQLERVAEKDSKYRGKIGEILKHNRTEFTLCTEAEIKKYLGSTETVKRFKVGDKVKIVRKAKFGETPLWPSQMDETIGLIGTVRSVDCPMHGHINVRLDGGRNWFYNINCLEKVTEPYKFKKGDRVLISRKEDENTINTYSSWVPPMDKLVGLKGTVEEDQTPEGTVLVTADYKLGSAQWIYDYRWLDLITEPVKKPAIVKKSMSDKAPTKKPGAKKSATPSVSEEINVESFNDLYSKYGMSLIG